jgi:hypothetical protein
MMLLSPGLRCRERTRERGASLVPNSYCPTPNFWFTEGFDTKDSPEAKTLLGSLVSNV